MSAIYLLPCHGDKSVEVTTAEAGRVVSCPCGKPVTVPTFREIQSLPRKQSADDVAAGGPNWSLQQGVLFSVGLFLAAACVVALCWLGYQRTQLDTTEFVIEQDYLDDQRQQVLAMDAAESLRRWNEDINKPLEETRARIPLFVAHREFARQVYLKMGVAGLFGVIGIGLMVAGVLLKPRPARTRKKPAKRPAPA